MAQRTEDTRARDATVDVTDRPVEDRRRVGPYMDANGNGTAIAAMVVGLFALVMALTVAAAPVALIFAIVAIAMGIKGMGNAKALGGLHKGLAVTGIVTGALGLLLALAVAAGAFALFTQGGDPAVQEQLNNLQQQVDSLTG